MYYFSHVAKLIKIIQKKCGSDDLRTNMPSFGKTNPLKKSDFADFIKAYTAEDRHKIQDERFSVFTREQIAEKGQ